MTLPFHIFDGAGNLWGLCQAPVVLGGKIFGKMFALIFPNARVAWSLIRIVHENPIVAVI